MQRIVVVTVCCLLVGGILVSVSSGQGYNPERTPSPPLTGFPDIDRINAPVNAIYECIDDCKRFYPPDDNRRVDCYRNCRKH